MNNLKKQSIFYIFLGVGYSTSDKLRQMNVRTCADLEAISLFELQKNFGKKNGQQLYDMCRGIDNNKLNLEHIRKSVSAEVNYGIRFDNKKAAHEFLKKLSDEISDRLKKINSKGKCVTLKVMFKAKDAPNEPRKFMGHGLCDAYNKSKNLIAATDDPVIITRYLLNYKESTFIIIISIKIFLILEKLQRFGINLMKNLKMPEEQVFK